MADIFSRIPDWTIPVAIVLLSIVALAAILERAAFLYLKPGGLPDNLIAEFLAQLGQSRSNAAAFAGSRTHPIFTAVAALLVESEIGPSRVRAIVAEAAAPYRRFLPTLGVISTVAPLLGLLGTVTGMIRSFRALGTGNLAGGALSGGIDEALITTALGLLTAIPAVVAYNYFASRANEITDTIELLCQQCAEQAGSLANLPHGGTDQRNRGTTT